MPTEADYREINILLNDLRARGGDDRINTQRAVYAEINTPEDAQAKFRSHVDSTLELMKKELAEDGNTECPACGYYFVGQYDLTRSMRAHLQIHFQGMYIGKGYEICGHGKELPQGNSEQLRRK